MQFLTDKDHKIPKLSQTPFSFHRLSWPWKADPIFPKLSKTFKECVNPLRCETVCTAKVWDSVLAKVWDWSAQTRCETDLHSQGARLCVSQGVRLICTANVWDCLHQPRCETVSAKVWDCVSQGVRLICTAKVWDCLHQPRCQSQSISKEGQMNQSAACVANVLLSVTSQCQDEPVVC